MGVCPHPDRGRGAVRKLTRSFFDSPCAAWGFTLFSRLQVSEPGLQPEGASVAATAGRQGKGTAKSGSPLALRSHFSFSFRACPPTSLWLLTDEILRALPAWQGRAEPLPSPATSTFVNAVEALPFSGTRFGPHARRPRPGSCRFIAPHNPCPPTFPHLPTAPLVLTASLPRTFTHVSADPHPLCTVGLRTLGLSNIL